MRRACREAACAGASARAPHPCPPSGGSGGPSAPRRRGPGEAAPPLAAGGRTAAASIIPLLCAFLILCFAATAMALEVPKLTGRVNDYANLLSPQTKAKLNAELAGFERTDSTQVVVLTIPSLEDESLEEYSIKVAEAWGIGQKGKDNGVLLLVSKGDRKVRIEVGYGLEGKLTDALSGRIIAYAIVPQFKTGNFDAGIMDGVSAIMQAVRGEYKAAPSHKGKGSDDNAVFGLFILAIILTAVLSGLPAPARAGIFGLAMPGVGALFGLGIGMLALLCVGGVVLGLVGPFLFSSGRGGGGGFFIGGGGGGFGSGGGGFSGGGGGFGGGGSSGSW
ncbi:TPM domain-containing protein [Solidesulfovibrio sp. C21]|uniref:TPM domain-containing protein n=1 Tax=Solidesulfovibrio sp. C21 TaxID=3398613 RepID=UPI0039FD6405